MAWNIARWFGFGGDPQEVDDNAPAPIEDLDATDQFILNGTWLHMASSNVEAIRYVWKEKILEVEFKDGSFYQYYDVPQNVVVGFVETASPGRYVWNVLRDQYDYARITAIPRGPRKPPTVVRTRPDQQNNPNLPYGHGPNPGPGPWPKF